MWILTQLLPPSCLAVTLIIAQWTTAAANLRLHVSIGNGPLITSGVTTNQVDDGYRVYFSDVLEAVMPIGANHMTRGSHRRIGWPALAILTTLVIVCAAILGVRPAFGRRAAVTPVVHPATKHHPVTKQQDPLPSHAIVACERSARIVCNPKASRSFKLRAPNSAGVALLSQQQVLSELGWSGDTVGAALMTYGQAQASFPQLAAEASTVVDPSREVWVITAYFSSPVSVPYAFGFAPPMAATETTLVT
jgi:hypothetical protein